MLFASVDDWGFAADQGDGQGSMRDQVGNADAGESGERVTVRQEAGCLEYFPALDLDAGLPVQVLDEDVVTIIEKWQDLAALQAHLATPHMAEYRGKVQELVLETSLKVLQPV